MSLTTAPRRPAPRPPARRDIIVAGSNSFALIPHMLLYYTRALISVIDLPDTTLEFVSSIAVVVVPIGFCYALYSAYNGISIYWVARTLVDVVFKGMPLFYCLHLLNAKMDTLLEAIKELGALTAEIETKKMMLPHDKNDPTYAPLYADIMKMEQRRYELKIIVKAAQKQHTAHKRALEMALRNGVVDKSMDNDIARLKTLKAGFERDTLINKLTHKFGAEVVSGLFGQSGSAVASSVPRARAASPAASSAPVPDVLPVAKPKSVAKPAVVVLPSLTDRAAATSIMSLSAGGSESAIVPYDDAPYGRKPDGTPYKSNAGRRSK